MWFREPGFKLYSWIFGCNLEEVKDPDLTHYKNLSEFFYRELKDGARPVDYDAALVSTLLVAELGCGSLLYFLAHRAIAEITNKQ